MFLLPTKKLLKLVYFNVHFSKISSHLCSGYIILMGRAKRNDQHNSHYNYPYNHFLLPTRNAWCVPLNNQQFPPAGNPVQSRGYTRKRHKHNNNSKMNILREWECITTAKGGFIFTVMSYNVLAQDLIVQHPYLYSEHKQQTLAWNIRWNNIFAKIKKLNPDILCLQEVQFSQIASSFSNLKTLGYEGVFKQRTGMRTDGCAIYYKTNVLKLLEYTTVEYNQPKIEILDRDNIGIIAKFSHLNNNRTEFIVATTHLLYNPKRQDVRLAQIQLFLTEIDRMAFNQNTTYLPIIITGDFNLNPESAVYRFLRDGLLKYEHLSVRSLKIEENSLKTGKILIPNSLGITDYCQHVDLLPKRYTRQLLSRSEELKLIKLKHSERPQKNCDQSQIDRSNSDLFSSGTLRHNFKLNSVYEHKLNNGDWEATTHQDQWISVDYIFYSNIKTLELLERFKLPTIKQLTNVKIPNEQLGSDHFCLCAKFMLDFS